MVDLTSQHLLSLTPRIVESSSKTPAVNVRTQIRGRPVDLAPLSTYPLSLLNLVFIYIVVYKVYCITHTQLGLPVYRAIHFTFLLHQ